MFFDELYKYCAWDLVACERFYSSGKNEAMSERRKETFAPLSIDKGLSALLFSDSASVPYSLQCLNCLVTLTLKTSEMR